MDDNKITIKQFCKELNITKRQFYGLDEYLNSDIPEDDEGFLKINSTLDIPCGFSMQIDTLVIEKDVTIFGKFNPKCQNLLMRSQDKDLRFCTEFNPIITKQIKLENLKTLPKTIKEVDWVGTISAINLKSFPKHFKIKEIRLVDELFLNNLVSIRKNLIDSISKHSFRNIFLGVHTLPNNRNISLVASLQVSLLRLRVVNSNLGILTRNLQIRSKTQLVNLSNNIVNINIQVEYLYSSECVYTVVGRYSTDFDRFIDDYLLSVKEFVPNQYTTIGKFTYFITESGNFFKILSTIKFHSPRKDILVREINIHTVQTVEGKVRYLLVYNEMNVVIFKDNLEDILKFFIKLENEE